MRAHDLVTGPFTLLGMRSALLTVAVTAIGLASVGCGGAYYGITAGAASAKLEEARQLGAETRAPYEYYYAKTHLDEAGFEASSASYSDAADYAEIAEEYAIRAIELSKASKAGGAGDAKKDGKDEAVKGASSSEKDESEGKGK